MCGENGAVSVLCSASGLETGFPGFLTQSGIPAGQMQGYQPAPGQMCGFPDTSCPLAILSLMALTGC
ncbi:hypothetical protein JW972_02320 [Escherichia fergusonii]|uniref:hypothetical protein n=1 Tax=Escherichia fergusonii TaxID=564 RepID=UPI001CC0E755|nr:hypothetical protein [Escherichia fergusonii]UAW43686.1 hypothetical protein JW972_02320 [Escherichia fergusonii]